MLSMADLSAKRLAQLESVWSRIDVARLREIAVELVSTPSPPGHEATLAHRIVDLGQASGLDAFAQHLDDDQANAVLQYGEQGDGPSLMLYAPIDTHTWGDEAHDVPAVGPTLRPDMRPEAVVDGDFVIGLGANNPKGHAACVIAAVEAVAAAGVPLRGPIFAGLGAGGMPTNAPSPHGRRNIAHGVGASFLIEQGMVPDFAVIAKTGWSVAWEEVGIAWFRIRVHGRHSYVGIRHFTPYDNPIVSAAALVPALEEWFAEYGPAHRSGLVEPQAGIGAIDAGWTHSPAFNPAACDLYLDVRLSPRSNVADVQRSLSSFVASVGEREGFRADVALVTAVPGTSTDRTSWIVDATVRAWETVAGDTHQARPGTSGATDANILRARGIPTARVGMPPVPEHAPVPPGFSRGMNVAHLPDMERLARLLVAVIVDTCTRGCDEVLR